MHTAFSGYSLAFWICYVIDHAESIGARGQSKIGCGDVILTSFLMRVILTTNYEILFNIFEKYGILIVTSILLYTCKLLVAQEFVKNI